MRTTPGRLMRLIAVPLTLGLGFSGESAPAQGNCKDVKGTWIDVYLGGNSTAGTIKSAGILNGTTVAVYNSGAVPTPASSTVSYTSELTITTDKGQLKANTVYLYHFPTGFWTAMGRIDTGVSTGVFAGATGVLYFNGRTLGSAPPITYPADVTGEVCLSQD